MFCKTIFSNKFGFILETVFSYSNQARCDYQFIIVMSIILQVVMTEEYSKLHPDIFFASMHPGKKYLLKVKLELT